MTVTEARAIAQQSPVKSLTTRLGELKEEADQRIANLALTLKQIDETRDLLREHGLELVVDLGDVGNAAAHARRAQAADATADRFTLPTGRVA